jgi:hypothetical protein
MPIIKRKTGIPVADDAPWGTHFCYFYETKEDLLDILVPYFRKGLENNEFCVWIISDILSMDEAISAMRKAISDFSVYVYKGQIEIIPHDRWYLKKGFFDPEAVFETWCDKYDLALVKGYEGLRAAGDTTWLDNKDWRDFCECEQTANKVMGDHKILALCAYCLKRCDPDEALDVVENHAFSIVKGAGDWGMLKDADQKRVERGLRKIAHARLYPSPGRLSSGRKSFTGILHEIAGLRLAEEAIVRLNVAPPVLYDHGLLAALKWYAEQFSLHTGINVTVRGDDIIPRPAVEIEAAMFHIAREALTNVVKHARASYVVIESESDPDIVRLRIADNGVGFDKSLWKCSNIWGVLELRERAISISGKFRVDSSPGCGTTVIVEAPL